MFQRLISFTLILISLIILVVTFIGENGYKDLNLINEEVSKQQLKNRKLNSKIADLKNKLTGITQSDWELEKKSRESLGLSRPDEIVYILNNETQE